MHEISGFLREFPPFDTATDDELGAAVAATEIEFYPAGSLVLQAGESASGHAYVLRTGHAELLDRGRAIDVLGPGDVVGLTSMLADLPPGLDVRAAEDLLVYRVDADAMLPLLSGRSGLRFVARTMRERDSSGRVADSLGDSAVPLLSALARHAVTVRESQPLADLVRLMHEQDASSAVVTCADGTLGIVTDHDLRNRVLAAGRELTEPVSSVMTSPVRTVRTDTAADDAVLLMLTYGVRHLPVVELDGSVVGVVEEVDLLAAQERAPLRLRRAIARAAGVDELQQVSGALLPGIVEAHQGGRAPDRVTASYSILVESLVARAIALLLADRGKPPVPFAWLVTGSAARHEMVPSSDLDSLMAWDGSDTDAEVRGWMRSFATAVLDVMAGCGLHSDANGVRADDPRFSRSATAWRDAVRRWAADPTVEQGGIYLATLVDARAISGEEVWTPVRRDLDEARRTRTVRRVFGELAAAHRPPTGFVRDLVIEASGEHRGTLDLKGGGLTPVVDVGRHLALVCGSPALETLARLDAAHAAGLLSDEDAGDLRGAFLFLTSVRLDHQTASVAGGRDPDDRLAPNELGSLARRQLRDALRVVVRALRRIDVDPSEGPR